MLNKSRHPKRKNNRIKYPSAGILKEACFQDYIRLINTYDKIYDKVNIALVFCSAVLIVLMKSIDFSPWKNTSIDCKGSIDTVRLFLPIVSLISAAFMVYAVIKLLILMKSRTVVVFDSIAIRVEQVYFCEPDESELWLIDKYTIAVNELKKTIAEKQAEFNSTITMIVASILIFIVYLLIDKGVM